MATLISSSKASRCYLNFRFRHAGSGFGLSYLPLPPTEITPDAPGSLASLLASCSYAPHHHALAHCDYAKYRGIGYLNAPSRELPRRKSRAGSRRPPGTWSSSTSRQPFPQYTAIRPFSTVYVSCLGSHGCSVEYRGTPDLDRPIDVGMERPRPYVRGQGPYLIMHLPNLLSPPYDLVLIRNLRSISSITTVLVDKGQGACSGEDSNPLL